MKMYTQTTIVASYYRYERGELQCVCGDCCGFHTEHEDALTNKTIHNCTQGWNDENIPGCDCPLANFDMKELPPGEMAFVESVVEMWIPDPEIRKGRVK